MLFDYFDDTEAILQRVLGGTDEFEDQITQSSRADDVGQVAVHSLAPGLSGAAVFLVRRIGVRGGGFIPWVVKVSSDLKLIIEERENNLKLVQGKLAAAPKLIQTGSSKMLIFEFAGVLADYNPKTLRTGYAASGADALAVLMRHIVTSLKAIVRVSEDTTSCVNRMLLAQTLEAQQNWSSRLPSDVVRRLRHSWRKTLEEKDRFPRIRSTGHGDLNSGNVLFEPGTGSPPVFIDFASMLRSKDNKGYKEDGYHLPFWDHAKLERDVQTRLFLKEAVDAGLDRKYVIDAIKDMNGVAVVAAQALIEPVAKQRKATFALREAMQKEYSPAELEAYRVVLAYAMLTVLFRERPDAEVQDLQYLVAAESSIALLADPLSPLPAAEKSSAIMIGLGERRADDRDRSTVLDVPAPGPSAASVGRWLAGRLAPALTAVNIVGALVITLIVVALFVYRFQLAREPRAEPPPNETAQANSVKPAENNENRPPHTPSAKLLSEGIIVTPSVSTQKPKTASLDEPPWRDVEVPVRQEFSSIKNLKKSGAFQCARAPDKTTQVWNWQWEPYTAAAADLTCRQDVELTQQGGNEVLQLFQAAVLFRRNNDRWEFWKVESRPIGPDR